MKPTVPATLIALCGLLGAPHALADAGALPPALDVVGKLHFLLLHFPIALLVAVLVVELLLRKKVAAEQRHAVTQAMLVVAVVGAVAASATGLVHASGETWPGHTGTMLAQHRAGGLVTAALAVLTLVAHRRPSWRAAFLPLLVASSSAVAVTGHRGGDLVHGEGYLLEAFRDESKPKGPGNGSGDGRTEDDDGRAIASDGDEPAYEERERWPEGQVPDAPDYLAHIKPIFERSCVKCHGPEKRKGGLRLDKKRFAMKGGETGPAIVPGNVAETLLIKYVTLPVGDEDLMPPRGKLLAQTEVETLKKWVQQGAAWPEDS